MVNDRGNLRVRWVPYRLVVRGVAYDTPVPSYRNDVVDLLRLWKSEAVESFDFEAFNVGDYYKAVEHKVISETVSKVLYPNDEPEIGKALRLAQQYFFVSCSDGAVVLRYSGQRTQQTYVPTATPLWGYYGYGWGGAYDPGYVRQNELVDVQTTVYSVPDRKLLWAGTTESMNPSDVSRTVHEIADAVAKAMRKEGLIPSD